MSDEVILEVVEEVVELIEISEKGDPGTPVQHNDLLGLQGGTVDEFFHLSESEVDDITANSLKNSYPAADASKLAGIDPGAEVNADLASQPEAEAGIENTKTMTSLRVRQAVIAWAALATSFFSGILAKYKEQGSSLVFTAGAGSLDHSTTDNIRPATLTQDSTLTITNLTDLKPVTLALSQTGGPWTLDIAYGAKTLSVTLNGAAGEALETVEVWCDGTDLFVPTDGGVLWSKGV